MAASSSRARTTSCSSAAVSTPRCTATGPPTWRELLAGPVVDRIRSHRHDHRADQLVVPGLFLRVPEHPEVPEEARDRRDDSSEVAADRATRADRTTLTQVVDPDAQHALPDRLTGRAPFEPAVVRNAEREGQKPAELVTHDQPYDGADDADDDAVDDRRDEPLAEVGARAADGRRLRGRWVHRHRGSFLKNPEALELEEPEQDEPENDSNERRMQRARRAPDEKDERDEHRSRPRGVRRERRARVSVKRRLDARRHSAERARHARQRAQRTRQACVTG